MTELWIVLPFVVTLLALSGFVKAFTALLILRTGVGLHGAGHGFVMCIIAAALAVVMSEASLAPIGGLSGLSSVKSMADLEKPFRARIEGAVDARIVTRLTRASEVRAQQNASAATQGETVGLPAEKKISFPVLVAAFVIGQLSSAVTLGLLLIIPFLVVDLLVTHVLAALGITTVSSELISLPLKLILFLSVGGVELVATKLVVG